MASPGVDDELDERPTPGERLLCALGQLFLLSRRGELDVEPMYFDVADLARIIGVRVQLVTDGVLGRSYHLAGEVLVLDGRLEFPWKLFDLDS